MQRFTVWIGVVAMVTAMVTAPLYHSHDADHHDHHGEASSLVHAHFIDDHESEHHADDEIGAENDHHRARWIDFFTFDLASPAVALVTDYHAELGVPVQERREGVVFLAAPRAHSPPGGRRSVPRSPPSI